VTLQLSTAARTHGNAAPRKEGSINKQSWCVPQSQRTFLQMRFTKKSSCATQQQGMSDIQKAINTPGTTS